MPHRWCYIFTAASIFLGCHHTPSQPTPVDEVLSLRIVSTMPGNTEGVPNVEYTFTAEHPPLSGAIEYHWDFDTTRIISTANSVRYAFPHDGWYRVTVVLQRSGEAVATSSLLVNIRSSVPDIPMVRIPAGTFLRGSQRGEYTEQPVVQVRISTPLLMSTYEITQAQWEQLMGISPSYYRGDNLPVESISWMDAVDFCNRLSIRHGLQPCYRIRGDTVECDWNANGYRLPTEAEWEYAAKAGTTTDVYSGNLLQPRGGCLVSDHPEPALDAIAWYCFNSDGTTHPVGQKAPNEWGLYDMIGNVAEFVWDWSNGSPYAPSDTLDPRGPAYGTLRRVRGGSFLDGAFHNRASARLVALPPTRGSRMVGFRIVRRAP